MQKHYGISLLELTIVVFILGVFALASIPNFSSSDPQKLNLAAEEITQAMRFARSEAIRTQNPHGFNMQATLKNIRVFSGNSTAVSYDSYHPVSKKLYTVDLENHPFATTDTISINATFQGTCHDTTVIYFDAHGIPWCNDPTTVPLRVQNITLTLDAFSLTIALDGLTGRITVSQLS